ncbi:MAG: alpha/beta hydrolase [SAR202 cluster bacterium]|jgi:acetyl esterase/lipase|nr:alpha/beta hydrolase [SAR202 cluster bacterium]MDP6716578.1 alpha/beta hydrolase [SAR202 cluster bacterium]
MPSTFDYDPQANYEVRTFDVPYQKALGQPWEATIYQPQGDGPFPAILFVHGGAWNAGHRTQQEIFNVGLASSGLVIASVDFRLAPDQPYPAQVQDASYGIRWLKAHASEFNASPDHLGGAGASSGGHTLMLAAMRPHDPRYTVLSSPDVERHDGTVAYAIAGSPVLDSYARYQYAQRIENDSLMSNSVNYFLNEETMQEGSPQGILDRGEDAVLPPLLIIQGTADLNIPMSIPRTFVESYRAASGNVEIEEYPDMPHNFILRAGKETDHALEVAKAFVARQLATANATV